MDNNTWVIEPVTENRRVIGCRWLFRKIDDGRYKARLVAKGYSQQAGIDYEETFALVAKFTTIRLLLALSCENIWKIEGVDVKTAFLNRELEETIYLEIPKRVAVPVNKARGGYTEPVACRLIKSIYGQKQSLRAWYSRIYQFFWLNSFTPGAFNHSLFINYEKQVILLLYLDDFVGAAPTQNIIGWICSKLYAEFQMTDLGPLHNFLGLEIACNLTKRTLHLSQTHYLKKIIATYKMELCNPAMTPADPHVRLENSSLNFKQLFTSRKDINWQSAISCTQCWDQDRILPMLSQMLVSSVLIPTLPTGQRLSRSSAASQVPPWWFVLRALWQRNGLYRYRLGGWGR